MKLSIGYDNRLAVLKIVGVYIIFGTLWIYLSDTILSWIVHDPYFITIIAIFKGTLFIVLTATLLYYLIARHVQKLKMTEEQLKESEERYRGILEDMEEAYYEVDLEGRFTFFNHSIARNYGYSEDALMGASYKIAMDEENIEKVFNAFHQVYVTGETIKGVDWTLRNKQGNVVHVEASVSLRRDSEGNPIGFKGITRDVTERKQAEESLRESEGIFRVLFNQSYNLTGLMKVDGTLINANSTALEFAGINESDVIGRPFWETPWWSHSEEQRGRLRNAVTEAAQGHLVRFETHHPDAEGHVHYIDFSIKPVKDENNNVVLLLPEGRDITERKQAEEALRESKELYTRLVDTIPDIVARTDLEGKILFVNDYTLQIGGYSREEIEGRNILMFIAPEDRNRVIQNLQLMVENKLGPHEYLLITKDGRKIPIEVNGDILRNENGKPFGRVHVCRDITERKQAENERATIEAQLTQAQKMESIGTLAGGIAHDFNNILSAIFGYTQLAMDDVSEPDKARKELKEVLKASERAKDLVSQILTFSRKADARYSPVSLYKTVNDSIKMMRSVIPTTIEIRHDLVDHGLVMADPTQIHQVMLNLCTNAAHAMDKTGGVMEVKLRRVDIDEGTGVRNPDLPPGSYLRLSVSDTGHGMTSEVMARIFDPYFTTKEVGRGTGLGLAVVHGIVQSHRGTITCTSSPGKGTTFDIYLPEILSEETEVKHHEERALPKGTERILFVDDEPDLVTLTGKMLSKLGYTVVTKSSSSEAFELFRKDPDKYDLVITDMTMPGMTGDRLAQKLMEIRHDIPIILCSGYSEHISEEKAKKIGIKEFVMKPLERKNLAETIRKVLDGR